MLRYSSAIQKAKSILRETKIAAVLGKYYCSYSSIRKREWWDSSKGGGTIVEQATHFLDLFRYFNGEVVEGSIQVVRVPGNEFELGYAKEMEKGVDGGRRIDRVTCCSFEFVKGGVGSLNHSALLHGNRFETEIDVLGDGICVRIINVYEESKVGLFVRWPDKMEYEKVEVEQVDMYQRELEEFVKAACRRDIEGILSPYWDAAKTYELSRWIADYKRGKR